jgi:hypothetical protein
VPQRSGNVTARLRDDSQVLIEHCPELGIACGASGAICDAIQAFRLVEQSALPIPDPEHVVRVGDQRGIT